jgi:hypothetical protein
VDDKFHLVRSIGEECIQVRGRPGSQLSATPSCQLALISWLVVTPRCLPTPQDDELRTLLAKKPNVVAYDGFEPSGRMHIAQARALVWSSVSPPLTALSLHLPAGRDEGPERE